MPALRELRLDRLRCRTGHVQTPSWFCGGRLPTSVLRARRARALAASLSSDTQTDGKRVRRRRRLTAHAEEAFAVHLGGNAVGFEQAFDEVCFRGVLSDEHLFQAMPLETAERRSAQL